MNYSVRSIIILLLMISIISIQPVFAQGNGKGNEASSSGSTWNNIKKGVGDFVKDLKKKYDIISNIATKTGQSAGDAAKQALDRAGKEISGVSTLVTGNLLVDIKADDVTSQASGNNSTSDIKIGTIGGSTLKNVLIDVDVDVNDVTSVASGEKSQSFVRIGSIENSKVDGIAAINVKAKDIASIASGQESRSSIAMGSAY